jgi:23S rRNA (cytidine1920-2'-O)/16S rRNA (cytidine1409-2'-O)-methyltransferase
MSSKRLDSVLVELGLAPSRSKAQQMISNGEIEVLKAGEWRSAEQASLLLPDPSLDNVRVVEGGQTLKYVSRGGLKLEGALQHLGLGVHGWRCLDIGLSTGGFSDCLLQNGATHVLGIDVGHGQLHARLKADARLQSLEGVNVKDLSQHVEVQRFVSGGLNLAVVDLSFISILTALPAIAALMPAKTKLLALIKPQFEVGRENLDKRGVVRDAELFNDVKGRVLHALEKYDLSTLDYFQSQLKGNDGNQEFFVFSHRA